MKNASLLIILFCLASTLSFSQFGCMDVQAANYNSSASINDGSCLYAYSFQPFNLKVNTLGVTENSGIEWINGNIFTFGDSGNPPQFYKIDTITGAISQSITVSGFGNTDWEDITADTGFVYIGDFGNNNGTRTDLKILKIAKSQFINNSASGVTVTAQAINFAYADQTSFVSNSSNNYDCESVINVGDSLYVFTKDRGDLKTRVYKLPKTPGSYTVSPYTTFNVNGLITGADYNPINKEIILIGYLSGHYNSFIWYLNDFKGISFFSGNKRRVEVGNSTVKWQTEGINFYNETSTTRIFISCETDGLLSGIYVSDIGTITGIKNLQNNNPIKINYLPDNSIMVMCDEAIRNISLFSILGQEESNGQMIFEDAEKIHIEKDEDQAQSIKILKLTTATGKTYIQKIIY